MGETFIAVVAGTSEAGTTAGASVKLDAALMQQLGREKMEVPHGTPTTKMVCSCL